MLGSMSPNGPNRPRIGIPWRTSEEGRGSLLPWRGKTLHYAEAVKRAGSEPVELSLTDSERLQALLPTLDGFVLPGSPADGSPKEYGRSHAGKAEPGDFPGAQTDRAIRHQAFP